MKYLGLLWFCLVITSSTLAQDTGQITGTVRDPSGASISNAKITVSGSEGGANRVTKTNGDGEYVVGGLAGGAYNLQIEAPGFRKYEAKGIVLRVAQKTRADATLQIGSSTSEVTVEGSGVGAVETQSSEM
ncbi:MAG TPA: carboxypeptidase-like regulatory domain-containing protein, partial [Terriglobales bacterium]